MLRVTIAALAIFSTACARAPVARLVTPAAAAPDSAMSDVPVPDADVPGSAPVLRRRDPTLGLERYYLYDCDPCLARARKKSTLFAAAGSAAAILYGVAAFGVGGSSFEGRDDGLFGEDTREGGADKVGHAVSANAFTAIFSGVNRAWGIPRREAALRGAIAAMALMTSIEISDGWVPEQGFTPGDMLGNAAGATFGYFHESSPRFARLFDLRWEYFPTEQLYREGHEPSTDYEGSAYFLAVNSGALFRREGSVLDFLDFQVGYKTRHYQDGTAPTERLPFVGIGINFSQIFRRIGWHPLAKVFEYYQPPFTSLQWSFNLDG